METTATKASERASTTCSTCNRTGNPMTGLCDLCEKRYETVIDVGFGVISGQEYAKAEQVKEIAEAIIPKWHPHLDPTQSATDVRIEYVYTKNTNKSRDKLVLGKARKVSGFPSWLSTAESTTANMHTAPEPFFVMEIAWEMWLQLHPFQKVALVDHELAHFQIDHKGDLYLRGHDVEEFSEIVQRHGLWRVDVEKFVRAAEESSRNPLFAGITNEESESGPLF